MKSVHAIALLASEVHAVRVITRDRDLGADTPLPVVRNRWIDAAGICVAYMTTGSARRQLLVLHSARQWQPSVLYFNSFFDFHLTILPQALGALGWWRSATRVVAVRGEFGSAALEIKGRKKAAFVWLYRILGLHRGVVWHASSDREAVDIRRTMGESARVLVRRNDSLLPQPTEADLTGSERPPGKLRAIFVGRLVPIKGLEVVLRALHQLEGSLHLDVYGPEEDYNYAVLCRTLADQVSPSVTVRFAGALEPGLVRPTISQFDLMLMPSRGENFGQVIAEALSCSVPVMLMDVTPWTDTIAAGGGVVVESDDASAWSRAIEDYAASTVGEWQKNRALAAKAYSNWYAERPQGDLFTQLDSEYPRA